MGFANGLPVCTRHDASYTQIITKEDFLETSLVLETSTMGHRGEIFLEITLYEGGTYPEFNKEYCTVRVNSHTSNCRMIGFTPTDEVALLVMHDMHKEHASIP